MINKIIVSFIFIELLIAIALSMNGITHVELGVPFMAFVKSCNQELLQYKIEIPNIPSIPFQDFVPSTADENPIMWNLLLNIANGLFTFLNTLITILNFVLIALNALLSLLQFAFIFLKNFITLKNQVSESASSSTAMFLQSI